MRRIGFPDLLGDPVTFAGFCENLAGGEIAVVPTDTLYGFAVDGNSRQGADALFRLKGREGGKPLILFLHSIEQLQGLGIRPEKPVREILALHWPGALTAVFPHAPGPLAAFGHDSLGIRIPAHPALLELLSRYPGKLLTTSVNRSGFPPMNDPDEILGEFSGEVSWLVDGGILPRSEPSTVADFRRFPPRILRQGKVRLE